ncbi:MAG TPA: hypothetical protein VFJ94_06350 [Intrasporangium sp.]|uniref:hypothetical protein n=1 Tax=Intrasporangium sp. TaxID=1925024 RepID=UPI002D773683|nr:hypothetical protein [Intrasporangium sp.]HET7398124.1 hypothetical protein [Intrasporangium sp.]
MAELLIRVGTQDAALIERVLQDNEARPDRVVVDAHVAKAQPRIRAVALAAGIPFIIDPQTHYLQDYQHPADPWASLPFAQGHILTPADLMRPKAAADLAAAVIDYQVEHDATAIVLPYVHIERVDRGWIQVQRALWNASAEHIRKQGLRLPAIAVIALGWRLLDRTTWPEGLARLLRTLKRVAPTEVALAASKVDAGVHPDARLVTMIATIRRIAKLAPVIAWQQGVLGEAAVAGGALGYECGIGWRERCDLPSSMSQHRRPPSGFGPRPVYLSALGRSLPKRYVEAVIANHRLAAELTCTNFSCCPQGRDALLSDMRSHAIRARRGALTRVSAPASPAWRWQQVAADAEARLDLAERVNKYAERAGLNVKVPTETLRAVLTVADNRRRTISRRPAA